MSDDDFSDPDDFFDTPVKAQSPQPKQETSAPSANGAASQTVHLSPQAVPGLSLLPSVSPPAVPPTLPPALSVNSSQPAPEAALPTVSALPEQQQTSGAVLAPLPPNAPESAPPAQQASSSLPLPNLEPVRQQAQNGEADSSRTQPLIDVPMRDAEDVVVSSTGEQTRSDGAVAIRESPTITAKVPLTQPPTTTNTASEEQETPSVTGASNETSTANGKKQTASDPDFLAAAEANKGKQNAEWQYDSSDAESSDTSSDSSDDDSDDDSDADDYVLLDPAEQARILMREEEGGGEDGGGSKNKGAHLRTANEKPDEVVEKPDIPMTSETVIKELGTVEIIVENYALVKGTLSTETQVLESGSALCLESRTVIGAVQEPIGRVEEPRYSVAFTNAKEIEDYGITVGTKIFYVPEFSTYVFTQALKLMKGTDASNVHDEEAGPEEVEFSDDEAEAEYKRQLKQEKLIRKGVIKPDHMKPDPETTAGVTIKADPDAPLRYDEDDEDDMYKPLSRPTDLGNGPMPPMRSTNARGNARGRGQDRGRGGRGRGGRGRGDQQSFMRGKDGRASQSSRHPDTPSTSEPSSQLSSQPGYVEPPPPPFNGFQGYQAYQGYQGVPGAQQQYYNPAFAGGGFPGTMPQYPQHMGYNMPPPGSFINPAFWSNMQAQMQPQGPPQAQQGYHQQSQQQGFQQHPHQQGNNHHQNQYWGR